MTLLHHLPEQSGFPTDHHIIEFAVVIKFKRADAGSKTFVWLRKGKFKRSLHPVVTCPIRHIRYCTLWKYRWVLVSTEGLFCQLLINIYQPRLLSIQTCLLGLTTRFAKQKKDTALRIYRLNKNDHNKLKLRSQSQHVKYLVRRKHVFCLANCI